MGRGSFPIPGALGVLFLYAAAAASPLRVAVRVQAPADEELLVRLQGQTVDLDLVLVPRRAGPMPAGVAAQLDEAAGLAQEVDARMVLWVSRLPQGDRDLHVAEPEAGTLLLRHLRGGAGLAGRAADSAAEEETALVARSLLRALSRRERPLPAAPAPLPEQRPLIPPVSRRPPLRWSLAAGWQLVVDGQSPAGLSGLSVRGGVGRGAFAGELMATVGLPATLTDDYTAVSLSRHGLLLSGSYGRRLSPRWLIQVGACAGVLLYQRSTAALRADVTPSPVRVLPAFVFGPQAGLRVLVARRLPLAAELLIGADVPVGGPELGYTAAGAFVSRNRFWPVQPRVELGLSIDPIRPRAPSDQVQ